MIIRVDVSTISSILLSAEVIFTQNLGLIVILCISHNFLSMSETASQVSKHDNYEVNIFSSVMVSTTIVICGR